ncbi:MAG: MerR family transcriptional regulator [Bacteroidetes bacterium]|nr:MerR family transcriptional regulator [Bacteroidota bacterium]
MPLKQTSFDFDFIETETAAAEPVVAEEKKEVIKVKVKPVPVEEKPIAPGDVVRRRGRIKLSTAPDKISVPEDEVLFEKRYYSIGAVSEMFNVKQSQIRYWENEFDILKPKKNGKGDRYFRPEDVKNLKLIYQLLRERKYTIEGARAFLKKNKDAEAKFEMIESLKKIKSFLQELKANL